LIIWAARKQHWENSQFSRGDHSEESFFCRAKFAYDESPICSILFPIFSWKMERTLTPMTFTAWEQHGLKPVDAVVLAYSAIVLVAVALLGSEVPQREIHLLFPAAVILSVLAAGRWYRPAAPPWIRIARDWYPVLITPLFYKQLTYLIPSIHPGDMDQVLIPFDRTLFGVDPTVWMERWTTPWLTEYLQIVYSTFYFLPFLVGIPIYRTRSSLQFQVTVCAVLAGFYSSYLGYMLVPALGPRFTLDSLQSFPLRGIFFYETIRQTLDRLEQVTRDAFPSGHTEVTLILLYCTCRYYHPLRIPMAVITISLLISTVYLRYHYVVDVLAGGLLAIPCILAARRLEAYWLSKGKS